MNTVERARGRWNLILPRLGVDRKFLVNRHGPCPVCGGKDRFRYDDKDGGGTFFCNQCGAGTGLILLRKLQGWDYKTACDAVDEIIGTDDPPPFASTLQTSTRNGSPEERQAKLVRMLDEATDFDIVKRYLSSRGLIRFPNELRGHPNLPYVENGKPAGRYPAMLAPVIGPDGSLQSVHRTYIGTVAKRKKLMPPVDTVTGGAVRLFDAGDTLGVSEGIETAIATMELLGVPTWAALTAGGLEAFVLPEGIRRLLIFADNDKSFTGQAVAYALARRVVRDHPDVAVEVKIPSEVGTDWLDLLRTRNRSQFYEPAGACANG